MRLIVYSIIFAISRISSLLLYVMHSNFICDSLCQEMIYPAPNHVAHFAHFPNESIIITLIVSITLVVLMIIFRGMILKMKNNGNHVGKIVEQNQSLREQEVRLKTRNDLISKLLTFDEKLAKEGSQHETQETRYRNTIICLLKKYCDLGDAIEMTENIETKNNEAQDK